MLAIALILLHALIVGIVVLSILILSHELGHFLVAKWLGVWPEEFGLGLPPRLWGKKIKDTIYSINWLPIGGFVRLHGETSDQKPEFPEKAFTNKSKVARILISLAGIVMNFVVALICFAIVYSIVGIPRETGNVRITEVASAGPAQTAGLLVGDIVRKVDTTVVDSNSKFISYIDSHKGKFVKIEVERIKDNTSETLTFLIVPREAPPEGEGPLGVGITSTEIYFPPIWQRPFVGAYYGAIEGFNASKAVVLGLFGVAGQVSKGQMPSGTVGPFGILALIEYVSRLGIIPLINFIGVISINLAIINLVPFPPLDGSRVLFIGIEAVMGKKMLPKAENIIQSIGMFLLILLMILITAREIPAAFKAGTITKFVESIVK